jgi:hypothetical protein
MECGDTRCTLPPPSKMPIGNVRHGSYRGYINYVVPEGLFL